MPPRAPCILLASLALAACRRQSPPCGEGLLVEERRRAEVPRSPTSWPVRVRPLEDVGTLRPDGKALAAWTSGEDSAVQIWDLEHGSDGEVVPGAPDMGPLRAVAWSPDGRWLARFTTSSGAAIWDLDRHSDWRVATGTIEHAAWSPDGSRILVGADYGNVSLLDPRAGKVIRAAQLHDPNAGAAMGFSWSPNGAMVAIVQISGAIDLWDAKTGATRKTFSTAPPGLETAVKWSPDGALLAMPSAAGVELFDGRTGASKRVLRAAPAPQGSDGVLAWSPDGAALAATRGKRLEVWDVKGATLRASIDAGDPPPHDLAWSPDGARLVFWGAGTAAGLWEAKRDAVPIVLPPCADVAFGRDGSWVRCSGDGDEPVALYDARTGERRSFRRVPGLPAAIGETFVQDPPNAPRLVRISDRQAIGFHRAHVGARLVPVAVTDEGLYMGDREAAAQIILRYRPNGKPEPLPADALSLRELRTLLSDFLADRGLPPVLVPTDAPLRETP